MGAAVSSLFLHYYRHVFNSTSKYVLKVCASNYGLFDEDVLGWTLHCRHLRSEAACVLPSF